jgi:hypothetical protein
MIPMTLIKTVLRAYPGKVFFEYTDTPDLRPVDPQEGQRFCEYGETVSGEHAMDGTVVQYVGDGMVLPVRPDDGFAERYPKGLVSVLRAQ